MRRTSFQGWPCSIARTVDLLGDAWILLVMRELFYGETRFDGFVDTLGIARNTLADRLRRLQDEGLIQRHAYQADPVRHEYLLTDKGNDFFGVLATINAWGDRWLTDEQGPPVILHHETCDNDAHAEVVCSGCAEPLRPEDTTVHAGPSYPTRLLAKPRVRKRFVVR